MIRVGKGERRREEEERTYREGMSEKRREKKRGRNRRGEVRERDAMRCTKDIGGRERGKQRERK